MRARAFPRDDDDCGWWAALEPPAPARLAQNVERADAAVVGAGLSGLATARRLAEHRPDWRIALLDAGRVGYGASGRNSGFVGDIAHRNPRLGTRETACIKKVATVGRDALRQLVRDGALDCDWSDIGRFHVAREPRAAAELEHQLAALREHDEPHTAMDERALEEALGTKYYARGVHIPGTVLVNPAALARGLAERLPDNVSLFESSPVRSVERGESFVLEVGDARVEARLLFLAVNGFAPSFGVLESRIFPLLTYASLTRRLSATEQAEVGGRREWGLVSEDRLGSTMRRTRDQRIFIRNGVRYRRSPEGGDLASVRSVHEKTLLARYPSLDGVELEHTWAGVLGMTMNNGQFFGQLESGIFATIGYNGTGVAMGTGSGMALADHALGIDSEVRVAAEGLPRPAWIPPAPLLALGVPAYTSWLQWRAGSER